MKIWLRAFLAGYAATLVFHQGALWLMHQGGLIAKEPFNISPVGPFGVPSVISLSFWGGVWGILLILFLKKMRARYSAYLTSIIFGALGPSLVALAVVIPLKGGAFMGGWNLKLIIGALILNGAWGLGTKLLS